MTFNYIITIHNKETLIEKVINGVLGSMGSNSVLYPVLDGCVDKTENIIDGIMSRHLDKRICKLYADDVHELKAINVALRKINQDGEGFNIIIQDDVILDDKDIEQKLENIYKMFLNLGILSLRHGANISRSLLFKREYIYPITNYIQSVCGHNVNKYSCLPLGYFLFREIAIKSPICIPFNIVKVAGIPDEVYAPWDDIAYCFKVSNLGYNNGVLSVKFRSDVEWGTTRIKKKVNNVHEVQEKNIRLFKSVNFNILKEVKMRKEYKMKPVKIFNEINETYEAKELCKDLIEYYVNRAKILLKCIIYR